MTDQELLELAAKAAGIDLIKKNGMQGRFDQTLGFWVEQHQRGWWNPLEDDGDALRLAVKLGLKDGFWFDVEVTAKGHSGARGWCYVEPHGNDPYAATRRAIVRAAAEIGRNMK